MAFDRRLPAWLLTMAVLPLQGTAGVPAFGCDAPSRSAPQQPSGRTVVLVHQPSRRHAPPAPPVAPGAPGVGHADCLRGPDLPRRPVRVV
ncbi:MAG TPA: hypothetical protein VFE82_17210 [Ramlibacter sp.]|jgi:hypothetical protein|uniref:hypothetical protein n=1 Tax=Ramlibacter sp. TaxID=1917967 RepID=UPI002D59F3B1|nr:hypothetical protein [Ramlibacter sp.]HZY20212.1 hypothetical protein [Ramlibacter sp.]